MISGVALVALIVGIVIAAGFAAALVVLTLRGRGAGKPDIPSGMRPGPSDDVLERRMIERFTGWNVAFVLFFAAWLPFVWFFEPNTNATDSVALTESSVNRGAGWFAVADEQNPTGFSCAGCHGAEAEGGLIPYQGQAYPVPSLHDVCARLTLEDVRQTIMEGREGTPMPSWSIQFEGPMNDQQIDDLINYLLTLNEKNVPFEQNKCTNPQAAADGGGTEAAE
jgi:mono/diheme cytochrome c family protein